MTRCYMGEGNTLPIFRLSTSLPPRRCSSAFWFLRFLTVAAAVHHRVSVHPLLATARPLLYPFGGDVFVQCRANRRRFRVSNILSFSFCCRSCITFCRRCTRGETFRGPLLVTNAKVLIIFFEQRSKRHQTCVFTRRTLSTRARLSRFRCAFPVLKPCLLRLSFCMGFSIYNFMSRYVFFTLNLIELTT